MYSIPTSFLVLTLIELAAAGEQKQKAALEKQLNLRPRQVEVWSQNCRAWCMHKKKSLLLSLCSAPTRSCSSGARLTLSSPSGNGRTHACMMKLKQTDACVHDEAASTCSAAPASVSPPAHVPLRRARRLHLGARIIRAVGPNRRYSSRYHARRAPAIVVRPAAWWG